MGKLGKLGKIQQKEMNWRKEKFGKKYFKEICLLNKDVLFAYNELMLKNNIKKNKGIIIWKCDI